MHAVKEGERTGMREEGEGSHEMYLSTDAAFIALH
jgi:hypothetical protein